MKLVFTCHHFPNKDKEHSISAGAEHFALRLLQGWCEAGHSAVVVDKRDIPPCTLGLVEVVPRKGNDHLFRDADVIATHLDETPNAVNLATRFNKPLVHLVHNHLQVVFNQAFRKADLYIFCANWVARQNQAFLYGAPWHVCYPLVFAEEWRTQTSLEQRDIVLLSNVNENKGGDLLPVLAQCLPDVKFVGITGAYQQQLIHHGIPNLEYVEHTPDPLKWYSRARVVICPSQYESFGRVPVEAMASGIPVIATGTDGMLESVGWGGQLVPSLRRNIVDEWTEPIKRLYFDDLWWHHWSRKARLRSLQLDAVQTQQLETAILHIEQAIERHKGYGPKPAVPGNWTKLQHRVQNWWAALQRGNEQV